MPIPSSHITEKLNEISKMNPDVWEAELAKLEGQEEANQEELNLAVARHLQQAKSDPKARASFLAFLRKLFD
jgi:hypothetical protein